MWHFPLIRKWDFPIIKKIRNFYKNNGLAKTILWFLIIVIGTKIVIINGFIALCNALFGFGWEFAPVGKIILSALENFLLYKI